MSSIDLIDKAEFEEVEHEAEEGLEDIEKNGKRRTTKQQLKVRRAIEDHMEKQRFRKAIDYLDESDFDQ